MRMAVILIKHMLTLWTMQFHMNSSGSHLYIHRGNGR